jgi:hypothetical protein
MSALVAKLKATHIDGNELLHAMLPTVLVMASAVLVLGGLCALRSIGLL